MAEPTNFQVLVIDHKPFLLDRIVKLLQETECVTIIGAVRKLDAVTDLAEHVDCDVLLYGFNAYDEPALIKLERVRALLPDAYIIASSFDLHDTRREEALEAGADEYLPGEDLAEKLVPRVLNHQRRQRRQV